MEYLPNGKEKNWPTSSSNGEDASQPRREKLGPSFSKMSTFS
jgi:hypothetical protein